MRRVNGTGPRDAKLCLVAEAPGAEEETVGIPFIGPAGKMLNECLRDNGLTRQDVYITNVVKYRPPDNKIDRLGEIGIDIIQQTLELKAELEKIKPNCVMAIGNIALQALCGRTGIKKWRGSLLESTLIPGLKVIPTIHPAAALRGEIALLAFIRADIHKARKESGWSDFRSLPKRSFVINPSYEQVIATLDKFESAQFLSLDIESIRGTDIITEIGLGDSPRFAITIPMYKNKAVWPLEQEKEIWRRVRSLLNNPNIGKIIQNVNFERTMLRKWVGEIYPVYMDTMIAQHLLYAELPKDLSTIASLHTLEPHWKSDKDADEYNVKDVSHTQECAEVMDEELKEINLYDFLHGYQMPFSAILWRATQKGVKVDMNLLLRYKEENEKLSNSFQLALNTFVGRELNVKSSKEVQKFLYVDLKLPVQRKKGAICADKKAIEKLRTKSDHPALELISKISSLRTSLSTIYNPDKVDPDGRMRTEWVITGTETGRLASRENLQGRGCNMQNLPKSCRDMFIADEGCSFIIADMSQVEARFVAWFSGDPVYKGMFKSGKDIHKQVAGWIFKIDPSMVTPTERQKAKATAHGTPYGMGAKNVAQLYNIPVQEATWLQQQFFQMFPMVKTHYQAGIQEQLRQSRTITNPHGRRRIFFGWWGEELFREAYASLPQGSAADTLNKALTRAYYRFPPEADVTPLIQVHDEWVIQVRDEYVNECAYILKEEVERPILVNQDMLSIPLDVNIGKNWKDSKPLGEN